MKKPIEISASILSADFARLADDIKRAEDAGVDRFHIDVMDGHFVPNLTIGPIIVEAVRRHTKKIIETHLMIEHPWSYLESYAKAGSDIIQIQAECYGMRAGHCQEWNKWPKEIESVDTVLLRQDLMRIRSYGKKAHVVFNPSTDVIEPVLDACDGVLIMSVNPGFAGQKFMPVALPKIARLKEIFKGDIEVDGGVNAQTAPDCVNAGAHVLITASYLFGAPDMRQAVNTLKAL